MAAVQEMNRRICEDYIKLEKDRVLQVRKIVFFYGRAMTKSSSSVSNVFGIPTISLEETQNI